MRSLVTSTLAIFGLLFISQSAMSTEFVNRAVFPKVQTIEIDDLYNNRDNYLIVDVRSAYEYETLHIKDAVHINMDEGDFIANIQALRAQDTRPIVFYCNGHTCRKAYQACQRADDYGVRDTLAFDAGVFDWTRNHPDQAVLLGQSPVDPDRLISNEKTQQHMLDPEEFARRVGPNSIVLDIRDSFQKEGINLFPMYQRSVPMDNQRIAAFVKRAKDENKTLLIYDAVGRQVSWLQYFLEAENVPSYYFMRGGARAFLEFSGS